MPASEAAPLPAEPHDWSRSPVRRRPRPAGRGHPDWRAIELPGRGTTFACDRPGASSHAPAVVLLHGWAATGEVNWSATMAALGDRFRVIALDHRGHGQGIRSQAPFTLDDCADDVVALLDVLGVPAATLAGYSMGGPIAQLVWRRHPDRVNGLVFCSTAADFTSSADRWLLIRLLEEMNRTRRVIPRSVRRRVARPLVGGLITDRAVRAQLLRALDDHHERSLYEAGQAVCRFTSLDWIGEIDVPTVVIVTKRDQVVRPRFQRQLAASIEHSHRVEITAAHMAPFTQPQLVADTVAGACDLIAVLNAEPIEPRSEGLIGRLRWRVRVARARRREASRRRRSARWHESDRWHRSARRRALARAARRPLGRRAR